MEETTPIKRPKTDDHAQGDKPITLDDTKESPQHTNEAATEMCSKTSTETDVVKTELESEHGIVNDFGSQDGIHKHFSTPDSEPWEKALSLCYPCMVKQMNPDHLIDQLRGQGIITSIQDRDIREQKTTSEKNRQILEVVRQRGYDGYIRFEECLRKIGQTNLADKLEKEKLKGEQPHNRGMPERFHSLTLDFDRGALPTYRQACKDMKPLSYELKKLGIQEKQYQTEKTTAEVTANADAITINLVFTDEARRQDVYTKIKKVAEKNQEHIDEQTFDNFIEAAEQFEYDLTPLIFISMTGEMSDSHMSKLTEKSRTCVVHINDKTKPIAKLNTFKRPKFVTFVAETNTEKVVTTIDKLLARSVCDNIGQKTTALMLAIAQVESRDQYNCDVEAIKRTDQGCKGWKEKCRKTLGKIQASFTRWDIPYEDQPMLFECSFSRKLRHITDEEVEDLKAIKNITGILIEYMPTFTLVISIDPIIDDSERMAAETECKRILRKHNIHEVYSVRFELKLKTEVIEYTFPGATIGFPVSCTLGCFANLGDDFVALISKHVAKFQDNGVVKYGADSIGQVLEPLPDAGLDIAAVKIASKFIGKCDIRMKDDEGKVLPFKLFDFERDDISKYYGSPVHIWSDRSKPGRGVIAQVRSDLGGECYTFVIIEDYCEERFAHNGDSGAIVCVTEPLGRWMYAVAMVIGLALGSTARSYICLPLQYGLKELSQIHDKTVTLCTDKKGDSVM